MKLRLRWSKPNVGETEVRLYRDTSPLDTQNLPAPLATLAAGTTEYTDASLVNQTTYHYLIGVLIHGIEKFSAPVTVFAEENLALPTGIWFSAVAVTGSQRLPNWDPDDTNNFFYEDNFALTSLFNVSRYAKGTSSASTGTFSGTINQFVPGHEFLLQAQCKNDSNGSANFDLEFKNADDFTVAALRCRRDQSYGVSLWFGPSLAQLQEAPATGTSYREVYGLLRFDTNGFQFDADPDAVQLATAAVASFRYDVDMSSVTKMVFTNGYAYGYPGPAYSVLELIGQQVFIDLVRRLDTLNGAVDLTWNEIVPSQVSQVLVYRDAAPIDPQALPATLATLAGGLEAYSDTVPDASQNYHYLIDVQTPEGSNFSPSIEALFSPAEYGIGAFFKMESTAGGILTDETTFGRDATLYGTYSLVAGIDGQAVEFAGNGSHADLGSATLFNSLFAEPGVEWAVAAWFKGGPPTVNDGVVVGRGGGTGTSATFVMFVPSASGSSSGRTPGQLTADIRGSYTESGLVVDDNEWHFGLITWNGTQGIFRADDVEVPLNAGTASLQSSDTPAIGCHTGSSRPTAIQPDFSFIGAIDRVRFFERSLSYRDRSVLASEFRRFYDFAASFDIDVEETTLTWEEVDSSEVVEVIVYRDTAPMDTQALPAPLATVAAGALTYLDTTVPTNDEVYYLIDVRTTGPVSHYSRSRYVNTATDSLLQFESKGPMVWYDLSDTSVLFQDTAGQIPVTAPGQNVQRVEDKSVNQNHAVLASGTAIWRQDSPGVGRLECSSAVFRYQQIITGTDDRVLAAACRSGRFSSAVVTNYMNPIWDLTDVDDGSDGNTWIGSFESDGFWTRVRGNNQWDLTPLSTSQKYSLVQEWAASLGDINISDARLYSSNQIVPSLSGSDRVISTRVSTSGEALFCGASQQITAGFDGDVYQFFVQKAVFSAAERQSLDAFLRNKAGMP